MVPPAAESSPGLVPYPNTLATKTSQHASRQLRTYRSIPLDAIPVLPAHLPITYLAEGAANIIYRIPSPLPPSLPPNHLLRIRKTLPSSAATLPTLAALQNIFFPLFPAHLTLSTLPVRLHPQLISHQNSELHALETALIRSKKRRGLYLVPAPPVDEPWSGDEMGTESEPYALLVEDMSPGDNEVLVEFKPKWVVQSPCAPAGWRRCRTCALRCSKHYTQTGHHTRGNGVESAGGWCPFDLASGDPARTARAVHGILGQSGSATLPGGAANNKKKPLDPETKEIVAARMLEWLVGVHGKAFFALLKRYQSEWDPNGPENLFGFSGELNLGDDVSDTGEEGEWGDEYVPEVRRFLMAMTVRDLTLFIKVCTLPGDAAAAAATTTNASSTGSSNPLTTSPSNPVIAKIGDLDLKSPANGKSKYWIDLERKLSSEGWYTGTEQLPADAVAAKTAIASLTVTDDAEVETLFRENSVVETRIVTSPGEPGMRPLLGRTKSMAERMAAGARAKAGDGLAKEEVGLEERRWKERVAGVEREVGGIRARQEDDGRGWWCREL